MTKAAEALHTTSHSINRRALLRGGSLATVALASPAAAHASPLAAAPSNAGRHILRLVAEQRALSAMWDIDEDTASVRNSELWDAIDALGKSIRARPIASLSDIVDRAILAAWACQPHGGKLIPDDVEGLRGAYIVDMLALAGIRPEQCNAEFIAA
jgi:hypothetical protein